MCTIRVYSNMFTSILFKYPYFVLFYILFYFVFTSRMINYIIFFNYYRRHVKNRCAESYLRKLHKVISECLAFDVLPYLSTGCVDRTRLSRTRHFNFTIFTIPVLKCIRKHWLYNTCGINCRNSSRSSVLAKTAKGFYLVIEYSVN